MSSAASLLSGSVGFWFEEQVLQPDHDRVEVEHGFPVLSQDVEADVALEVDVRVVDLWNAFDLWRFVGVVGVDGEGEGE